DEAGYGPMLGPLCVGLCVLGLDNLNDQSRAPDVWTRLAPAVVRTPKQARASGGVAVDDSKKLKLSNALKTRHPLVHLERGVLACARSLWTDVDGLPADDGALCTLLGCRASPGVPVALPIANETDPLRLTSAKVSGAMASAGVRVLDLSCRTLEPGAFNERLGRLGTKAAVSWSLVQELVARLWRSHAVDGATVTPRLVLDRQGGRTDYLGALRACVGEGPAIETIGVSPERSAYEIVEGDRRLRVLVQRGADADHFPVALASMTAKYVRELAMERFNRSWADRLPELKPTAGYVQDARRWLSDVRASGVVGEDELAPLIRRA
ncbi:MAG: hypothetical protein AAGH64_07115, partial [Planctomycetota bacterium]